MSADTETMPDDIFQEIVAGVEQMVATERGEIELQKEHTHEWTVVNVKRVRQSTKTTQMQFAKLLGVGVDTIKSWESGRRNPSGSAAKLLTLISKDPIARSKELAQS